MKIKHFLTQSNIETAGVELSMWDLSSVRCSVILWQ